MPDYYENDVIVVKFGDEMLLLEGKSVRIARIISRLTGAPLINLYVGIIMTVLAPQPTIGTVLDPILALGICIVFMVILPIVPIIYQAYRGNVDLDVSSQNMRTQFFLFAIFFYIISFSIYYLFSSPLMYTLSVAYIGVTTGVMIANRETKVSVHTAGIAGPGTALIIVYGLIATPVIILWGAVIWSRMKLEQHTMIQGLIGVVIGVIITFPVYSLLYPF